MLHGVATLMARSLRLEARLLRTHLFRLVFVFFIYMMMLMAQAESLMKGAPGKDFFSSMLWLNAIFITAGAVSFFVSAITEEKEENTLGLLLMTGLNPLGILFGKSTARMLQAIFLLTVQFPFTLLAITLGGVLLNQVIAAYASLLAYTILLSNLSLFWSVISKRTGTAAAGTSLCLAAYSLLPLAAQPALPAIATQPWAGTFWGKLLTSVCEGVYEASVFQRIIRIQETGFDDPPFGFQVVSNVVAGLVFFLLAWALFGRFALHADTGGQSRSILTMPVGRVRRFAPGRAWHNPLVWKDYHFIAGGRMGLIVKVVALIVLYPALMVYFNWESSFSYGDPLQNMMGAHLAIAAGLCGLEASVYASRIFHDEIRWQTMSALLTLPRSIEYVAYSKVAGCLLALVPTAVAVLIDTLFLPEGPHAIFTAIGHPAFWTGVLIVSIFLHLVVLLSLFVKWGALPLAIVMTIVLLNCTGCLFAFSFALGQNDAAALVGSVILLVLWGVSTFVFQMMIHARLYELGSK